MIPRVGRNRHRNGRHARLSNGAVAALIATDWPELDDLDEEYERTEEAVVVDGRWGDVPDWVTYEGLTW